MSEINVSDLEKSLINKIDVANREIRLLFSADAELFEQNQMIKDRIASLWMAVILQFLVSCLLGVLLYFKCRP